MPYTPGHETRFYLGLVSYLPASAALWAALAWWAGLLNRLMRQTEAVGGF